MSQSVQIPVSVNNLYIQVTVLRDGGVKDISIFDLLVGDVMLFETGDIVPADGVIITGNTIRYSSCICVVTHTFVCVCTSLMLLLGRQSLCKSPSDLWSSLMILGDW